MSAWWQLRHDFGLASTTSEVSCIVWQAVQSIWVWPAVSRSAWGLSVTLLPSTRARLSAVRAVGEAALWQRAQASFPTSGPAGSGACQALRMSSWAAANAWQASWQPKHRDEMCIRDRDYTMYRLQIAASYDLATMSFDALCNQSMSFHSNRFGGTLVSQTTKFMSAYQLLLETITFPFLPVICSVVFTCAILAPRVPAYVAILMVLLAVYAGVSY